MTNFFHTAAFVTTVSRREGRMSCESYLIGRGSFMVEMTQVSPTLTLVFSRIIWTYLALELVQELSEYLAQRYPKTFQIERCPISEDTRKRFVKKGWGDAPPVKSITIIPLRVTYELNENAHEMLQVAALLSVHEVTLFLRITLTSLLS